MSVRALTWAWESTDAQAATGTDLLVLLALADWADDEGEAFPKVATIARKSRVSVSTVRRSLRHLESLGLVEVEDRHAAGLSSIYRLPVADPFRNGGQPGDEAGENLGTTSGEGADPPVNLTGGSGHGRGEAPVTRDRTGTVTRTVTGTPSPDASVGGEEEGPSFDEFWGIYPRRNGRKVGKAAARRKWDALSPVDRVAALDGARNYADAVEAGATIAKDAERFLAARNRVWEDWQDSADVTGSPVPKKFQADAWATLSGLLAHYGALRHEDGYREVHDALGSSAVDAVRAVGWTRLCRMPAHEARQAFAAAFAEVVAA